jgi:hypothetical protein
MNGKQLGRVERLNYNDKDKRLFISDVWTCKATEMQGKGNDRSKTLSYKIFNIINIL